VITLKYCNRITSATAFVLQAELQAEFMMSIVLSPSCMYVMQVLEHMWSTACFVSTGVSPKGTTQSGCDQAVPCQVSHCTRQAESAEGNDIPKLRENGANYHFCAD